MIEKIHIPGPPLNRFVELIWIADAARFEAQASHHAALFTELIFNFADQFLVEGENIAQLDLGSASVIASGLKAQPFQTTTSGRYLCVGLILKPFCYPHLLKRFKTKTFSELSETLHEQLIVPSPPRFHLVEPILLRLFQDASPDSDLLRFERHISPQYGNKNSLKHFADSLSITHKSFIQRFKRHYSLTPSKYVRLRQVNHAIQLLQSNSLPRLVDIALESGFYDQAHFNRVFKQYCGVNPKQFHTPALPQKG